MPPQIEHQHQVLKTLIDNFPAGISLFDSQLRLVTHNPLFRSLLDFPGSLLDRPVVRFEDLVDFSPVTRRVWRRRSGLDQGMG